jgi:hypothetical protein
MLASTSLASIGETTFDVVNEPVAAGPLIVRPGVQVAGSIRTATGMTIPIEYDSLAVVLESTRMWWSQALPLPMRSDSSGDFSSEAARSFNLVAVGPYRVRVEGLPSGLYVSSLRYGAQDVLRQGFLQASAATEGERLDIVIDGPGGIVDGIVRNAADEPIPSAWVVLIPDAQRRQNVDLFRTALTDQTGRFSIDAVPPGGYGVLAWTGAVRQDWLDPTSLSAFETQTERIQIDNGDRETLDLDAIGRSD